MQATCLISPTGRHHKNSSAVSSCYRDAPGVDHLQKKNPPAVWCIQYMIHCREDSKQIYMHTEVW